MAVAIVVNAVDTGASELKPGAIRIFGKKPNNW